MFATYQDTVTLPNGSTLELQQGDIYLDLSSNTNGIRVNFANDVDKARSLYSASTLASDADGDWNAVLDGVDQIYDGLTIALRISKGPNDDYNTLKINDRSDTNDKKEIVWFRRDEPLTTQIPAYSEVILTYRSGDCGSFQVTSSMHGSLPTGTIRTRGWVVVGVHKMNPLILGDDYVYDGSQTMNVPLGTIITLKTWESSVL